MNTHSHLCRFLGEHPRDWETLLERDYDIHVRQEGPYAIFNYGHCPDFADPLVQEARGIILNTGTLEVACWPFRKFGNHTERYADPIDWATARVLEKVDGSIIKLWFDPLGNHWQFSTNGMIRAEAAPIGDLGETNFAELIRSADNYHQIPFDRLDRTCTYIFELVSPRTQVVVLYETTSLYHIGTRSNLTGQESEWDMGIRKPASYPISSLGQCLDAAIALNTGEGVTAEGFVVVDGNWNRVKVKSPEYLVQHALTQKKTITKTECLQLLLTNREALDVICGSNPNLVSAVKYYDYQLARICQLADRLCRMARALYAEYSGDRAAVARIIGRHPMSYVAFRGLGNTLPGRELLLQLPPERMGNWIPDYEEEDLNWLFRQDG